MLHFTSNDCNFTISSDQGNLTHIECDIHKNIKKYNGILFINLDYFNLPALKFFLSQGSIEILNRIAQYGLKIIFYTTTDLKHREQSLETIKAEIIKNNRKFPDYSVYSIPSENNSTNNDNILSASFVITSSLDTSLLGKYGIIQVCFNDTQFDYHYAQKCLGAVLNKCRDKLVNPNDNLKKIKMPFLIAIEDYLAWRNDKNMHEGSYRHTMYPLGLFTRLRHWTDFGKKRAENLRTAICAPNDLESLNQVLRNHFTDGHSRLNHHSLDTHLIEADAKPHTSENATPPTTEKERITYRNALLEKLELPPIPMSDLDPSTNVSPSSTR